jgi:hypothetical protein
MSASNERTTAVRKSLYVFAAVAGVLLATGATAAATQRGKPWTPTPDVSGRVQLPEPGQVIEMKHPDGAVAYDIQPLGSLAAT